MGRYKFIKQTPVSKEEKVTTYKMEVKDREITEKDLEKLLKDNKIKNA